MLKAKADTATTPNRDDYWVAVVTRFYHLDARQLTYPDFMAYLGQIQRVRKYEAGIDPDAPVATTVSSEDLAEQCKSGELNAMDVVEQIKRAMAAKPVLPEAEKRKQAELVRQNLLGGKGRIVVPAKGE